MTREEALAELKDSIKGDGYQCRKEVYETAIEALEQEPCEDAVSRQAIFDTVVEYEKQVYEILGDENELVIRLIDGQRLMRLRISIAKAMRTDMSG